MYDLLGRVASNQRTPFLIEHHTQRLSLAAVMYDAMAVRKRLLARRHTHAAHVAPEGDA